MQTTVYGESFQIKLKASMTGQRKQSGFHGITQKKKSESVSKSESFSEEEGQRGEESEERKECTKEAARQECSEKCAKDSQ